MIEQVLPQRIVELEIHKHGYSKRAGFVSHLFVLGHFVVLFRFDGMTVLHILDHYIVYALELNAAVRRIGALPIAARKIFYFLVGSAGIEIYIRIVETVCYFRAGMRRSIVFYEIVILYLYFVRKLGFAVVVHTLRRGIAFCREYVIERVVRVRAGGKIIIARFEYVRFLPVRVVSFEFLRLYRDGERITLVRREVFRLCKPYKLHRRFFYAMFGVFVVIGVRFLQINLQSFLARVFRSAVGYGKRNLIIAVVVLFYVIIAVCKIGIRSAVAERIRHFVGVIPSTPPRRYAGSSRRCAATYDRIFVPRFVITVSDVYAFLIYDIFIVVGHVGGVIRIAVDKRTFRPTVVAEINVCGRGIIVVRERVGKLARNGIIASARQYRRDLLVRHRSRLSDPNASVYAETFYMLELHRVIGIYEQHDFGQLVFFAHLYEIVDNVLFVLRDVEIILIVEERVVAGRQNIALLARYARYDHDRGVGCGHARFHGARHRRPRRFIGISPPALIRADKTGISQKQIGIVLQAVLGENGSERVRRIDAHAARAVAQKHIIHRRHAEHAHSRIFRKRQCAAVVPQQNAALYGCLQRDFLRIFAHRFVVVDRMPNIVGVLFVNCIAVHVFFGII